MLNMKQLLHVIKTVEYKRNILLHWPRVSNVRYTFFSTIEFEGFTMRELHVKMFQVTNSSSKTFPEFSFLIWFTQQILKFELEGSCTISAYVSE